MNRGGSCVGTAELAVKIPKINADWQNPSAFALGVFTNVMLAGVQQAVAIFTFDIEQVSFFQALVPVACAAKMASSSLHDGAHTACDLPSTLRVPISERARCLPHIKHDIVAAPNEVVAANGEPDTLDL